MNYARLFLFFATCAFVTLSQAQNNVDIPAPQVKKTANNNSKKAMTSPKNLETDTGCTTLNKSEWLSQDEMALLAKHRGYQFEKVKISYESCYEIYGSNREGDLVEAYFDPSNARLIRQNIVKIKH
ncbi:PepSY domain-containing protein [Undibacterium sp. TC9W]|uniref:PepSY domain-containing protein n=1 Tax=Undibacterium sp. TC9W TaxID=3413053 RepID=UPI003BF21EF0